MTALSNEEVVYKEEESAYYHIKYYLEDDTNYVVVATTRPETLFGDTAVAVNANDERYKDFIGKNVKLPLTNRLIPIITDEHADMTKGTGAVNVTPFGSNLGNSRVVERLKCYFIQLFRQRKEVM